MIGRVTSAIFVAALAAILAGCGGGPASSASGPGVATTSASEPATDPSTTRPATPGPASGEASPPNPDKPHGPAESAAADPRETGDEQAVADLAQRYIAALDSRDGQAVCALMATGAIYAVHLPVRRPGECRSLSRSIGYRDPAGLPVWARARVARVRSVSVDGADARVVLTVVTRFADRPQASVEDDVIYMTRASGSWLVAKPSSTLYRAVGIADVPPSVLSAP